MTSSTDALASSVGVPPSARSASLEDKEDVRRRGTAGILKAPSSSPDDFLESLAPAFEEPFPAAELEAVILLVRDNRAPVMTSSARR
jgi:hypothetical protein